MDANEIEKGVREYTDSRTPEQVEATRLMYQGAIDGIRMAAALAEYRALMLEMLESRQ